MGCGSSRITGIMQGSGCGGRCSGGAIGGNNFNMRSNPNEHLEINILLKKSEIDYDIGMITHVVGNREIGHGATQEQGWNLANTNDHTGEVYLIARWIENAVNEVKEVFRRYLIDWQVCACNILDYVVGDYVFRLCMPRNFDMNLTKPLRAAAHEFVVNRTLYDWFMRTKPDEAHLYKAIYENALERLRSMINRRMGGVRTRPFPH